MNKQYLIIDASGFVLAHLGSSGQPQDGLHFASSRELPCECKAAIEALLSGAGAGTRSDNRAACRVEAGGAEFLIRLVETIRIERTECNLKRALGEALFAMSLEAKRSKTQLNIKLGREVPETVIVDRDKLIWAATELVRAAITCARPGSMFMAAGKVGVELSFEPSRNLMSVLVERDGARGEVSGEVTQLAPGSAVGKLVRAVVEAHGGVLVWGRHPAGAGMCTKVSFTIPAV